MTEHRARLGQSLFVGNANGSGNIRHVSSRAGGWRGYRMDFKRRKVDWFHGRRRLQKSVQKPAGKSHRQPEAVVTIGFIDPA
jgi:hypothetical protein